MPIVDITPVGSKTYDRPSKIIPIFLVIAEDPTSTSKVQQFLAVKLDELSHSVKIVGFETKEKVNKIAANYQEMINSADKMLYKEIQLPWQRVVSITNLIFKQK
jgi:hypothetical protein